jgi:hypothetical protein
VYRIVPTHPHNNPGHQPQPGITWKNLDKSIPLQTGYELASQAHAFSKTFVHFRVSNICVLEKNTRSKSIPIAELLFYNPPRIHLKVSRRLFYSEEFSPDRNILMKLLNPKEEEPSRTI